MTVVLDLTGSLAGGWFFQLVIELPKSCCSSAITGTGCAAHPSLLFPKYSECHSVPKVGIHVSVLLTDKSSGFPRPDRTGSFVEKD
jgi:hypothetical protein